MSAISARWSIVRVLFFVVAMYAVLIPTMRSAGARSCTLGYIYSPYDFRGSEIESELFPTLRIWAVSVDPYDSDDGSSGSERSGCSGGTDACQEAVHSGVIVRFVYECPARDSDCSIARAATHGIRVIVWGEGPDALLDSWPTEPAAAPADLTLAWPIEAEFSETDIGKAFDVSLQVVDASGAEGPIGDVFEVVVTSIDEPFSVVAEVD